MNWDRAADSLHAGLTRHYLTYAFLCATSEQKLVLTGVSADELVAKGLDRTMVEKAPLDGSRDVGITLPRTILTQQPHSMVALLNGTQGVLE